MKDLRLPSLWLTWIALSLLTLISVRVGPSASHGLAVAILFALAALKANLVLDNFMEAPLAEDHWRWLYRTWILVVMVILIVGFAIS